MFLVAGWRLNVRLQENLGRDEIESILSEQGQVEVGCEFCGAQYRFDPVDAAQVFLQPEIQLPGSDQKH